MELRLTSARAIILETLKANQKHWTIQEIYQQVKNKLPSINISTVYRAMEYLSNNDLISVSDLGWSTPVYESVTGEIHHHIVCQECGSVSDLSQEAVQDFFESVSRTHKFSIRTNHLVLFGKCEICRKPVESPKM